jgi:prevent-host-death family protein
MSTSRRHVSAKDARAQFSELMNRALFAKEEIVVTKNGKPAVAIIPIELLEEIEAARLARTAEGIMDRYDEVFKKLAE